MKWSAKPVEQLCESIIDCVNKTAPSLDSETQFKMIRTTNVRNGWVDTQNVKFVAEETFRKWTRRGQPRQGDVVLTREAPLGEVGMIRTGDELFLGQRTVMYRADPRKADNRFLLYALLSPWVQAEIQSLGSGSTVEHMRVPDCGRLSIPVPSLNIQKKIGGALGAFDDLIENNQRRIEILEEMARLLYREWFVHFRFPGHEDVELVDSGSGPIPSDWNVSRLEDILTLEYGKALRKDDRNGGKVPVIGSSGVVGAHDSALASGPGVVVGRKGNVGSIHWVSDDFYPIDTTYYVRTDLPLRFIYELLASQTFVNSHAAVPGLSRQQAYAMEVVVPGETLIREYDRVVAPFLALCQNLALQNEVLTEARDLLLPRLVSGELDVSELDLGDLLA